MSVINLCAQLMAQFLSLRSIPLISGPIAGAQRLLTISSNRMRSPVIPSGHVLGRASFHFLFAGPCPYEAAQHCPGGRLERKNLMGPEINAHFRDHFLGPINILSLPPAVTAVRAGTAWRQGHKDVKDWANPEWLLGIAIQWLCQSAQSSKNKE